MEERKIKSIHIFGLQTKHAGVVTITFGIKIPGSYCVLKQLKSEVPCTCPKLAADARQMACAYVILQTMKNTLTKSHLEDARNKIIKMDCNWQNGEFYITVTCAPQVSVVNRIIHNSMKILSPNNYQMYSANINLLNSKPNREDYDYCSSVINKALKTELCIMIAGKMDVKKHMGKFSDKLDVIIKGSTKVGKAPFVNGDPSKIMCGDNFEPLFISGVPAVMLRRLLKLYVRYPIVIRSNKLCIYTKGFKPEAYKAKVDSYIGKYIKFKPQLAESIAFLVSLDTELGPKKIYAFVKSKPTLKGLSESIKKSLVAK